MALTKTVDINVFTLQQLAANTLVNGSEIDVTTYVEFFIGINLGRDDTGGALTAGVIFRVQANPMSSGNDQWQDVAVFQSGITNPESEAVSGTVNAGQAVITVAATANLVTEDLIFIKNGTLANSEFHRIKAVSANTSVTVDDNLTNAQTGATLYDQAEKFSAILDVSPYKRLRLQVDNAFNSRTVCAQAKGSAVAV